MMEVVLGSMPVLTASAPMSDITASIWARTISTGTSKVSVTPRVRCAVITVKTEAPYTPRAANVFRSACVPVAPPGSEALTLMALGGPAALIPCSLPFFAASPPAAG